MPEYATQAQIQVFSCGHERHLANGDVLESRCMICYSSTRPRRGLIPTKPLKRRTTLK